MDKGMIYASLYQNPRKQGELAIKCLYEIIIGERAPDNEILFVPQIMLLSNKEEIMSADPATFE